MKKWLFGFFVSCIVIFSMSASAAEQNEQKLLIIYYSLTGNTDYLAKQLQQKTNADLYKIETVISYPDERSELMKTIKKEQETQKFPVLKDLPKNLESYDKILVGGPVWFRSLSSPISSLLKQIDFKGKKVAPFCTCGNKAGKFFSEFKKQAKNAKVLQGFELCRYREKDPVVVNESIDTWLKKINE